MREKIQLWQLRVTLPESTPVTLINNDEQKTADMLVKDLARIDENKTNFTFNTRRTLSKMSDIGEALELEEEIFETGGVKNFSLEAVPLDK